MSLNLAAQRPSGFIIKGVIVDSITQEPIENVNITVKDNKFGTTSDELGAYQIRITQLPFSLEFSHVSYQRTELKFEFPPLSEIYVQMKPKSEILPELVVTAQKIDTIYKDELYSVNDYELTKDGIVLLIFKARLSKSELLYTDFDGNEIMTLPVLPGRPLALFKDCFDNIHILTKTRVYQIIIDKNRFGTLPGVDMDEFKSVMGSCLFNINNKLYFELYSGFNFTKLIFYINTHDSSFTELTTIVDQEKYDLLKDNPEDWAVFGGALETPTLGDLKGLGSDIKTIDQIRHLTAETRFIKMAFYEEIYAPALPIGDTVCIFNHPNNSIDFYSYQDSLVGSVPIAYHLEKKANPITTLTQAFAPRDKWSKTIIVDREGRKAYTLYRNLNGTKDLINIDLASGNDNYVLTIPFPFVQKIQVYKNYLYFVYKGWGSNQNKKLFRQKIF